MTESKRFLIEVPHEATPEACARVAGVFLSTGSHFLSRAHWGCNDGEHKAWIVIEVDNKEDARRVIPPQFRADAKVIELNYFTMEDLDELTAKHEE
jgi:hypothetical protein